MNSLGSIALAASPANAPADHRRLLKLAFLVVLALGVLATAWVGAQRVLAGRIRAAPADTDVVIDLPSDAKRALIEATHGPRAAALVEGPQAEEINKSLPFTRAPIEAAAPFRLATGAASEDRARAQLCMTQAIYYEAGFETSAGRQGVAQVVLNRLRHSAFPKSVCGVVYEGSSAPGCQFSFTCDGSLRQPPAPAAWAAASEVAREALAGKVDHAVGQATHYHADYVAPYWAPKLAKIVQLGAHIFYRWPGGWGLKRAFTGQYAGHEVMGIPRFQDDGPMPASAATLPPVVYDRHAPSDVGGRLDISKGWTLAIPDPNETRGALSRVLGSQTSVKLAASSQEQAAIGKAGTR